MREDEAIKFLETLEVGTFLTVNIPISPNQNMPVTAMYAGKDKDGRYEFLDTGEFILSKNFLEKGKISIEKEFDEENLFNNEILHQYDEDGQRSFLGHLIRYEKWTVEEGKIIFPDINSKNKVQKLLKDYDTDVKKYNLQIMRQDLRNVSVFGLARLEYMIKRISKEIEENERETKQEFTKYKEKDKDCR